MGQLEGKVALVTGASGAIGGAIAIALAREGARVVLQYNRGKEKAQAILDEVVKYQHQSYLIQGDLFKVETPTQLVDQTVRRYDRLDILVNAAGTYRRTPLAELTPTEFAETMKLHVGVPLELAGQAIKHMLAGSCILNFSSDCTLGHKRLDGIAYDIAKAGVIAMTQDLARGLKDKGIRVNAIAPGYTLNESHAKELKQNPERLEQLKEKSPTGRINEPEDIAKVAIELCKPDSQLTGEVPYVIGGIIYVEMRDVCRANIDKNNMHIFVESCLPKKNT